MLEKLAVHHELWIKMLVKLGCKVDVAKDIVQEMYLKLHKLVKDPKRIMYGDDVNRYFVWVTLKNMYFSYLKKGNKTIFYEILENDDKEDVGYNLSEDEAFQRIMETINKITKEWAVYDRRLFDLYFIRGFSLRAISRGSKIGLNSIHNSVIKYREILRKELSEDLIDYFNEDFDKI